MFQFFFIWIKIIYVDIFNDSFYKQKLYKFFIKILSLQI